jgi:mutator protein MutT
MKIKKAVAVVIEDSNGKIFLTQRGRISRDEFGKWENCGGAVDKGETEEDAIKREVKEELGCGLKILAILYKDKFTTDSGAVWQVTIFKGDLIGRPTIQNKDENMNIGWFSKKELEKIDLTSYTRADFVKFGWIKS